MTSATFTSRKTVLLTAGIVALVDQISKFFAVQNLENRPRLVLIEDYFFSGAPWVTLTVTRNTGAAFSFGTSATWVFSIIAVVVIGVIFRFSQKISNKWWLLTLGLMMGGALGNLVDRIFRDPGVFVGGVVDFVAVEKFAIFNVADAAITIAAIAIVFLTVFRVDETKNKNGI